MNHSGNAGGWIGLGHAGRRVEGGEGAHEGAPRREVGQRVDGR